MNDRSLSVYVKKWITVFNVNKLNFIYFTSFLYTFVNCKYNFLLKTDDVCLIPLSTLVTLALSRFDEAKEIRIEWPRNPILNVVATLQQRCDNVGNRRLYNSHFRPCHNVMTTSTMNFLRTDFLKNNWERRLLLRVLNRIFSNYEYSHGRRTLRLNSSA